MRIAKAVLGAVIAATFSAPAVAESLQCAGGFVSEGDSRLSVQYKCGQPTLKDSYCAPLYYLGSPWPVPAPFVYSLPCTQTEEWLYERGPGNLLAIVRFTYGSVQSISYGRTPR